MMPYQIEKRYRYENAHVRMEFDLKNKTLIYYLNNQKEPCAQIEDVYVEDHISYKLAVFVWGGEQHWMTSSITLTKFEIE